MRKGIHALKPGSNQTADAGPHEVTGCNDELLADDLSRQLCEHAQDTNDSIADVQNNSDFRGGRTMEAPGKTPRRRIWIESKFSCHERLNNGRGAAHL